MRVFAKMLSLYFLLVSGATWAQKVGFQSVAIPVSGGSSIPVDIWYPTSGESQVQPLGLFHQNVAAEGPVLGTKLALIVISHGNGGSKDEHYDTALALARAGFVVAALEHTGDNYRDQSRATDLANRTRELHRLIDFMLAEWNDHLAIDPLRVGAFGFSSGGFTVLAAAGGQPDLSLISAHCSAHPKAYDCSLLAAHPAALSSYSATNAAPTFTVIHDTRIRALVVAAPALGFTYARGLAAVTQPVQLWRADDDKVLPAPDYADAVRAALPVAPKFHAVAGADHFDFLAPCSAEMAKVAARICRSEPGFDREAFHKRFNDAVILFFEAHLQS
jgi:predicted dienelactone hydrolase